jgi:hypothetical protein
LQTPFCDDERITMGRHERRRDLARFRRVASRTSLLTFLLEPNDQRLNDAPLLKAAASNWLDNLAVRVRCCIICNSWLVDRQHVGALLLSVPATTKPTSAGTAAICCECWTSDLPANALDRACTSALQAAVPNGRFEAQETRR